MQPRVSIVTPSYNQAAYLEATIRSVLSQDYPALEYLLVDGGSDDGSLEIIHKYEQHFAWWVTEQDRGQADAINKGLRKSTGAIIAWLNSDDLYLPGTLQKVVTFFEEHPQVGLVYGDLQAIDGGGTQINLLRYPSYTLADLMTFHIIGQPAVFFRRNVMEQAGLLDLSYHYLLDHQLWVRMAGRTTIAHIPETLAAARYHEAAKNVVAAGKFGEEAYRMADWMRSYEDTCHIYPSLEKKIMAGACLIDGRYLLDGDEPWQALKAYVRSIGYHIPTGLREFHRLLFALAASAGLVKVQNVVERRRKMNKIKSLLGREK
ncbi:MAG: glycosyltransferase [Chloroflexi bacterium]|nr:glycosyltransferase [Chloroflexota bacterium]